MSDTSAVVAGRYRLEGRIAAGGISRMGRRPPERTQAGPSYAG